MITLKKKKQAQAVLEYVVLLLFVIGAILVFQKYVARSISGRWKAVGDTFGSGRQFDPNRTAQCAYDTTYTHKWYNVVCYDDNCDACFSQPVDDGGCKSCIIGCTPAGSLCNKCASSNDCIVGQVCSSSGQCQCAGDCDGNGSVSVAEVNNAQGNVSTCPGADIDGDGIFSLEEVQRVRDNQENGCP